MKDGFGEDRPRGTLMGALSSFWRAALVLAVPYGAGVELEPAGSHEETGLRRPLGHESAVERPPA